jgi:hypothetical protein
MARGRPYTKYSKCLNVGCEKKPGWRNLCIDCFRQVGSEKEVKSLGRPPEFRNETCFSPKCWESVWCKGLCRTCYNSTKSREYRVKNPDTNRKQQLALMGMTQKDYDNMAERQGNLCAICRRLPVGKKFFDIDHRHSDLTVRGLLCNPCNVGLGSFSDNAELLQRAVEYINTANTEFKVRPSVDINRENRRQRKKNKQK